MGADSIGKPMIESMINALRQARKVTLTRERSKMLMGTGKVRLP